MDTFTVPRRARPGDTAPLLVRGVGGGAPGGPAVLLCHGFGASGDDLVPLSRALEVGPGVRWFFPEGPLAFDVGFGMEGRAWWMIDLLALERALASGKPREIVTDETPAGMPEALEDLEACVSALVRDHGVDPARLVIGGFSQGAMLACHLAARGLPGAEAGAPRVLPAGLVLLSGALVSGRALREALATAPAPLRVFQSHGRQDPLLPFPVAERLRDTLQGSGAQVRWVPFDGQHEIPPPVVSQLGPFLRTCLET